MKFVLAVIIIVGLSLAAWQIYKYWGTFHKQDQSSAPAAAPAVTSGQQLPGMPSRLESVLSGAQERGASGLRDFLATYGKSIADPRLAWIQLDYVVLVAPSDLAQARKVFGQVKSRIGPESPVYNRVQQLEKTYDEPK